MQLRSLLALTAAAALLAAPVPVAGEPAAGEARAKPRLTKFATCGALTRYARRHARRIAEPYGIPGRFGTGVFLPPVDVPSGGGGGGGSEGGGGGGGGEQPTATPAPQPQVDSQAGGDFSGTNVQEEGVDEPDLVKSDGSHMFVAAGGKLHALSVRGETPRLLGSLPLPGYGNELLLSGDTLLAFQTDYHGGIALSAQSDAPSVAPVPGPAEYETVITEIDVSDPARMQVVRSVEVPGTYVSARRNGGTARVVLSAPPADIEFPPPPAGTETPAQAERRVKRGIARTRLSAWRPGATLVNHRSGRRAKRRLVRCAAVRRPREFAGLGLLTVLTIDIERGLPAIDSDGLFTDAHTVYGSRDSLYVATERWVDPAAPSGSIPSGRTTSIHKFGATSPTQTAYRASGAVRGFLHSQWSLSEHRGFLRVASTSEPSWWADADGEPSQSFVTVLEERSDRLAEIGRVGNLGRGEEIYAVRFIGDTGYVVTFRRTDPLYTIDLSDPARPRVLGELKILGYSAYLHPVAEDLLLGVGQDATEEGRVRGTQLSLFDVSDLRNPVRLHQHALGSSSSSEAEYDHRAFLYWAPENLAVLPVQIYGRDAEFTGAIGFRIDPAAGISEAGRIEHPATAEEYGYVPPVSRALVAGERLFTVSDVGVRSNRLDSLTAEAFVPFE